MIVAQNILDGIHGPLTDELVQTLASAPRCWIERIVSLGHASPEGFWYDQDENEWVLVVAGAAKLRFEGQEPMELTTGSFVHLPAHQRHRIEWTDPNTPTVWLAVWYQ